MQELACIRKDKKELPEFPELPGYGKSLQEFAGVSWRHPVLDLVKLVGRSWQELMVVSKRLQESMGASMSW